MAPSLSEKTPAKNGSMGPLDTTRSHSLVIGTVESQRDVDADELKLATMGYEQTMPRNFSVLSVLGIGFSLTNSWFGISAALVTGINSGGPLLIIYGIILIALVSTCVGITLSELASAMPNAGGQYFWAGELAPPKWADIASYATGWLAWAGSIFTSASVAAAVGSALVGCWQLTHPDFTPKLWHTFVAYQIVNIFAFFFNCYSHTLPKIAQVTLYTSLLSFVVILITIPATAPTHQHASFVFATFINNTGWKQSGIAFIVGLVNTNWSFACLDAATHLAEEVHSPERMVPIAIMGTVAIGFVTSWFFSIAMFFSIVGDFADIAASSTGVPMLELFFKATQSKAGAIVLECLIICTGVGCLIASHTWQSRLCWSFARDRGMPGHSWLSKVDERLGVPVYAHAASCALVAVVGCLYVASLTAFNSMITACIVLLYASYIIPVAFLLFYHKRAFPSLPSSPFYAQFSGKFHIGAVANVVLLLWTLFTLVMYSFPYQMPVAAASMNYVTAVYAVVVLIMAGDWFLRGRKRFRGIKERRSEADEDVKKVVSRG